MASPKLWFDWLNTQKLVSCKLKIKQLLVLVFLRFIENTFKILQPNFLIWKLWSTLLTSLEYSSISVKNIRIGSSVLVILDTKYLTMDFSLNLVHGCLLDNLFLFLAQEYYPSASSILFFLHIYIWGSTYSTLL